MKALLTLSIALLFLACNPAPKVVVEEGFKITTVDLGDNSLALVEDVKTKKTIVVRGICDGSLKTPGACYKCLTGQIGGGPLCENACARNDCNLKMEVYELKQP